jgi:hypothetical protein
MRYNRASIDDTMRTAERHKKRVGHSIFVYATGAGYLISSDPPCFPQAFFVISMDGNTYHVSENGQVELR